MVIAELCWSSHVPGMLDVCADDGLSCEGPGGEVLLCEGVTCLYGRQLCLLLTLEQLRQLDAHGVN